MNFIKTSLLTILAMAIIFQLVSGKPRKVNRNRKNRYKGRKLLKNEKQSLDSTEYRDKSGRFTGFIDQNTQVIEYASEKGYTDMNTQATEYLNRNAYGMENVVTDKQVTTFTNENEYAKPNAQTNENVYETERIEQNTETAYESVSSTQKNFETNIYPSMNHVNSKPDNSYYSMESVNVSTVQYQSHIISTESSMILKSNFSDLNKLDYNLTYNDPYIDEYQYFNSELDNLTDNLQQVSKDWYYNVRFHCSNSWKAIQEVLEENRKALIDWQTALFYLLDNLYPLDESYDELAQDTTEEFEGSVVTPESSLYNMTVPPELNVKFSKLQSSKCGIKSKQKSKTGGNESRITSKCVSAINLAEALRAYWKEEIIECLQTYLKEIKHEEVSARHFEDKINLITLNRDSLVNLTGECEHLNGKEKLECKKNAKQRLKSKLSALKQELERHYLNHEVQNLQITMGIEMCRQVGKIYDKTMDQQLQAIQRYSRFTK